MSKFRASDDDIKAFMVAIFPDGAELATAAFDERYVLQEATRLIAKLRAETDASADRLQDMAVTDIRKTREINVLVDENRALLAKVETFTETERLAVENANRAWSEVERVDAVLSRIETLRLSWCAWQERIQADYWKDQGVVSILEKAIRQLGEVAGPVGARVRPDAPKHGIWGNDDAVLEAAKDRAAAKIEAI